MSLEDEIVSPEVLEKEQREYIKKEGNPPAPEGLKFVMIAVVLGLIGLLVL